MKIERMCVICWRVVTDRTMTKCPNFRRHVVSCERKHKCTCTKVCDCQDYEKGLVSNECPVHNVNPQPSPNCPAHGRQQP